MKILLILFVFLGACTKLYTGPDASLSNCCCAEVENGLHIWSCASWPYLRDACYPTERRAVCKDKHHHRETNEKHSHWHKH